MASIKPVEEASHDFSTGRVPYALVTDSLKSRPVTYRPDQQAMIGECRSPSHGSAARFSATACADCWLPWSAA